MHVTDVSFGSAGRELYGTLFVARETVDVGRAAVLLAHGHGSDQGRHTVCEIAEAIAAQTRAACFTFDLSGYGETGGDPDDFSPLDHRDDMVSAFDYLVRLGQQLGIGVVGAAGGSYAGCLVPLLSRDRHVNSLLLRAPTIYPDDQLSIPRGRRDDEAISAYRTVPHFPNLVLDAVSRFQEGQVIVVRSEADPIIPDAVISAYVVASRGVVRTLPGGHSLDEVSAPLYRDMVVEWAKSLDPQPEGT